jgi:hypothetical protein
MRINQQAIIMTRKTKTIGNDVYCLNEYDQKFDRYIVFKNEEIMRTFMSLYAAIKFFKEVTK